MTATSPAIPLPGSTSRSSSPTTRTPGPRANSAVPAAWPEEDTLAPMPTASEEPSESKIMRLGRCASSPSFVAWLHMTPDEAMTRSDDRS